MLTREGGKQFTHSMNPHLEFFSKAGSMFTKSKRFYPNDNSSVTNDLIEYFRESWNFDKITSMKLLFWLRDCRGGSGNRSGFRELLKWIAKWNPEWLNANISMIPECGRWDDLRSLFFTNCHKESVKCWGKALINKNVIAAKWAARSDQPLFAYLKKPLEFKEIGDFRRYLANLRKEHIVEFPMCEKKWDKIVYDHVPSVAMSRYTNAFGKHDKERFDQFKEDLKSGKKEIHADVLFPHDCVRTSLNGDREIANAQFDALPNYLEGTNEKIIVLADTSGSMDIPVSGSVEAIHISQGMALYCSAKIPKENPFHKKFIGFCSEAIFKIWDGMTFSDAIHDRLVFDHAIGSTRIDKALYLILNTGRVFNLKKEDMPSSILIISDMQFSAASDTSETEILHVLNQFPKYGYEKPKIIFWNTAGYSGSPEMCNASNTALISGFSPSVLRSIFQGDDLSPLAVMCRTLEKYEIKIP